MCRLYGVTRAGYYAWRRRPQGVRAQEDEALASRIARVHADSRYLYGSPRVHRELQRDGLRVGKNRVARLMRHHGLRARVATIRYTIPAVKRFFADIPNRQHEHPASQPNEVWVGDITYLKVGAIYRYLAVVLDRCSRAVVGWSFGRRKDVALTLRALNRAVANRRPPPGLVFHTDRGIEYAASAFRARLAELGITQSMNRPGKVTDNAFIESFFHSMKSETMHGYRFTEDQQILTVLRSYIPFYNRNRIHSSLDYVSPATYEKQLA
ncbi:MAG: IS3 family transposase [Sulfuritalea sp.]|nr:IS3 family transposase [Sulfuritalea sp.]